MSEDFGIEATPTTARLSLRDVLRPTYRPRKIRNKAAIVALLWNFCGLSVLVFFLVSLKQLDYRYIVVFGLSVLVYPVAGWATDVFCGKYRVLKRSIWIAWFSTLLYVVAVILADKGTLKHADVFKLVTLTVAMFATAVFFANSIQFGVDQLEDASSNDVSSFFSWFTWFFELNFLIMAFTQYCTCKPFNAAASFIIPLLLTLGICLDMLFNHWLVKQPTTTNPLKLIFGVLNYAFKNKYPRLRSAFMYWDNTQHSRLDLAKSEYGGPFTMEQVEDVKTFFRLMVVVFFGSLFVGMVVSDTVSFKMMLHFTDPNYVVTCGNDLGAYAKDCFERVLVHESSSLTLVVFIPVFEILLYPLHQKYILKLGIMKRFIFGMFLFFLYQLILMALEIAGHQITSTTHNVTCVLQLNVANELNPDTILSIDYKWLVVGRVLRGFSMYCLLTSTMEFIFAQAPYSMRGILGGMIYCLTGLSIVLSYGTQYAFQHVVDWKQHKFDCGVGYLLFLILFTVALIIVACVVTKCYSRRKRDDSVQVEHSIESYDKYSV